MRTTTITTLLSAQSITKRYGATTVLDGVDFAARAGEIVAITGENGAGKTTLMRICAGLLPADQGTVSSCGGIGYCPQSAGLFELLTADEHLVMFGRAVGLGRDAALKRGRALLNEFGYPVTERAVTRDLSGGTRQKLNLALALLGDPGVLLLDEPYQGFDRGTYVNFWDQCQHWRDKGKADVVVTHMLAELERVDRIEELRARRVSPHPSASVANEDESVAS